MSVLTSSTFVLPEPGQPLTELQVTKLAALALRGIVRQYPNKPGMLLQSDASLKSPLGLHPVFYGCYDWHSAVHSHWMLARLAGLYPQAPIAEPIRTILGEQFTRDKLLAEADYFNDPSYKEFERPYGWAWLLRLATDLRRLAPRLNPAWFEALKPLELVIVELMRDYLARLSWPIRSGTHTNLAFALAQALDYARNVENAAFETQLLDVSRSFYLADRDYPAAYEPSGDNFFSPGLNEADLMRRVLDTEAFGRWFDGFLPGLRKGEPLNLLQPVHVSDITDGQIIHLAGLNLARAWCWRAIGRSLPDTHPGMDVIDRGVRDHMEAGLSYVFSGHYEGEHWLASFAVYLLTDCGLEASSEWVGLDPVLDPRQVQRVQRNNTNSK